MRFIARAYWLFLNCLYGEQIAWERKGGDAL
jgi:hypothetical protein